MFKYIIKRLLISIIILFGVSLIIYSLVRLMPNNYVETKYAEGLSQGTIKEEDIKKFIYYWTMMKQV